MGEKTCITNSDSLRIGICHVPSPVLWGSHHAQPSMLHLENVVSGAAYGIPYAYDNAAYAAIG